MKFYFGITGYCNSQISVLLLRLTILLTQLKSCDGGLPIEELSERIEMTSGANTTIYTLSITTAKTTSVVNQSFGLEKDNTTPTERSEHMNSIGFTSDNETKLLNASKKTNFELFGEPLGNTTDSFANVTVSSGTFFHDLISFAFVSVGFTVSVLNLIVIIVAYSTRKLRQNTYLNLILTLSVSDFLLGLTTLLTGIRRLSLVLSRLKELCTLSNLIVPTCFIASLYQCFLISLHRYLVISGSEWGNRLFKQKRKYIWYIACWVTIIAPLSCFTSPPSEVDHTCSFDTIFFENRYIVFCITAIPKFVCMSLTLVFYFAAICSLKRHYLNVTIISKSILENKRKKLSKSMRSVSILLLVLVIFSGPIIVRNFLSIIQVASQESLLITFVLANINSLLNPFIYFINIEEFKEALRRPFYELRTLTSSR